MMLQVAEKMYSSPHDWALTDGSDTCTGVGSVKTREKLKYNVCVAKIYREGVY